MDKNDPEPGMLGPTSADATGSDFTDGRGRRWIVVGEVTPKDFNVAESERGRRNADDPAQRGPESPDLSRDELAEKLRPRRLVGGYEYQLEEPDYEVADNSLSKRDIPVTDSSPGTPQPGPKPKFIIGPDDRQRLDSPRFWPGSGNAYLRPQGCTATMIGPSTALCAAHCFFNNGWISSSSITFGADTAEPTAPFGSFLADSLTLPGAWNSNEWDWDFAVLEFSPSRPDIGRQTGWFGTAENFNGGKRMVGYPSDQPVPSSWIKGGSFTEVVGSRYRHNMDIIPGDSGAGAYDDSECVNGVQSTQWTSTGAPFIWNEVRRWDTVTYNFFQAYGSWPRS